MMMMITDGDFAGHDVDEYDDNRTTQVICSLFRPGFILLPVTGERGGGRGNLIPFKCNVMAKWSVLIVAIISIFSTSS